MQKCFWFLWVVVITQKRMWYNYAFQISCHRIHLPHTGGSEVNMKITQNEDGKKWVKIVFNCIIFISFIHHILIRSLSLLWKIDTLHVCCFSIFCIRNKTNIDEKFSSILFECFIKLIPSTKSDNISYPAFPIRLES